MFGIDAGIKPTVMLLIVIGSKAIRRQYLVAIFACINETNMTPIINEITEIIFNNPPSRL